MMSVGITYFTDYAGAQKKERQVSLDALVEEIRNTTARDKASLPLLKLARFGNATTTKGSLRHDRNVISCTGCEVDYDGERIDLDAVIELIEKAGLLAIVHTSPSHRPDAPRWRVLCPFRRSVAPALRGKMVDRLNGLLKGIAHRESWTLSQAFYYGSVNKNPDHRVELIDGIPLDELDELDEIALVKPKSGAPGGNGGGNGAGRHPGPIDEQALLDEIRGGENYHVPMAQLAGLWAHRGADRDFAKTRLRDAFYAMPGGQRDDRWQARFGDIGRTVDDIYEKHAGGSPEPEPLIDPNEAERPYPLDALPTIVSAAVQEYRAYGQQPLSMVASSALASTSLASQGLADVARDAHLVGPISLNFLSIAGSGERKTSTDREFTRSLREWQTEKRDGLAGEVGKGRAANAAWEAEKEGLLGKIKASGGRKAIGEEADIKDMTSRLSKLEKNKPPALIVPSLFYEDINAETLAVRLAEGWPSASLWSDEGGIVIGSGGMSDENLMKFVALLTGFGTGTPSKESG